MGWNAQGVSLTREQIEKRRLAAGADLIAGMKQSDVARKHGVTPAAVSLWAQTICKDGIEGLRMRKARGNPSKLDRESRERLVEILETGPEAYGWDSGLWTSSRVVKVIRREFGVRYHPHYMPRLLRRLGFRPVKPKRRASEKDEDRKDAWLRITWVRVKKN